MSFADLGNRLYTGEKSVGFVEKRKIWYGVSLLAMIASVIFLFSPGLKPGIEFRGGSEFRVTGVSNADLATDAVAEALPGTEAPAQLVGSSTVRVQTRTLPDAELDAVRSALAEAYKVPEDQVASSSIGPSWGADVTKKAVQGLVVFLVLLSLVMAAYFRTWTMAAASLLALLHDLLITAGVYALVGFEVTPASVIGFLTILGYSLYDTVVVFDKVRENTVGPERKKEQTYGEAANLAINQTIVRSVNTSVVALLPVAAILFVGDLLLGAGTLRDISLALFVGMLVGAYSSIFVAAPLLVDLRSRQVRAKDVKLVADRDATAPVDAAAVSEPEVAREG